MNFLFLFQNLFIYVNRLIRGLPKCDSCRTLSSLKIDFFKSVITLCIDMILTNILHRWPLATARNDFSFIIRNLNNLWMVVIEIMVFVRLTFIWLCWSCTIYLVLLLATEWSSMERLNHTGGSPLLTIRFNLGKFLLGSSSKRRQWSYTLSNIIAFRAFCKSTKVHPCAIVLWVAIFRIESKSFL